MNIGKAAKSILKGSPTFSQYVEWRPEPRNRFFLIEKETGKVLKTEIYAAEAFFFLHFINAYEENYQVRKLQKLANWIQSSKAKQKLANWIQSSKANR